MSNLSIDHIRIFLMESLPPLEKRILTREIDELSRKLADIDGTLLQRVMVVLQNAAEYRYRLYSDFQEMMLSLPNLRTADERNERMLGFLETFGPKSALSGDRAAFERWLDTAGVRERARVAMHESDRFSEMSLHLMRDCIIKDFGEIPAVEMTRIWTDLDMSRRLEKELEESPRWQNHVTVLKVWEGLCGDLPEEKWRLLWSESWDRRLKNLLSSPEENTWLQLQAFKLCAILAPEHTLAMIHHRFMAPGSNPDDVFLRTGLLDVLETCFSAEDVARLIHELTVRPDPSEHVRISAARKISCLKPRQSLPLLTHFLKDSAQNINTDKVLASAALSLEEIFTQAIKSGDASEIIQELQNFYPIALDSASGYRFQRALVEGLGKTAFAHAQQNPGDAIDAFDHDILQSIDKVIISERFPGKIRRIAAEIRESIILDRIPSARKLFETIIHHGKQIRPGDSFTIPADQIPDDETIFGRVLARISVKDYGYYAQPGKHDYRIWRGELFKRRAWRILHEFYNPDPAKRQGHVHTIGRVYPGVIRAHARYLSETTETKVPGERLFFQKEYSWRPFIPTLDDLLSTTNHLNAGKTIQIFSSEGVFSLKGPKNTLDRFMLWWQITLNYQNFVQKRHYDLEDVQSGHSRNFVQFLQEDMGFGVSFESHGYSFNGKFYSAVDPQMAIHAYPLIRNQLEWRPLS